MGHRFSLRKVRCEASTNSFDEPFIFTIPYPDPDIAAKRVGENTTLLLSCHWPGGDESICPIVISIIDITIWSIVNAAISGLPDSSQKIRVLWGCREQADGDGGLSARNDTPIIPNNTAAGCVMAAMNFRNERHFCIVYCAQ